MGYVQNSHFSKILTESFEKVRIDLTLQFDTKNTYDLYYTAVKF